MEVLQLFVIIFIQDHILCIIYIIFVFCLFLGYMCLVLCPIVIFVCMFLLFLLLSTWLLTQYHNILLLLLLLLFTFIQGIYIYIPDRNDVSTVYSVAAILQL
jgi:hypothetical protein